MIEDKEAVVQRRMPLKADGKSDSFWNFPDNDFSQGPEWRTKDRLLLELIHFGQASLKEALAAPDEVFHPRFTGIFASANDGMRLSLFSALTDWLLFDHAVDEKGRTIAALYQMQKKLFMTGLQKRILPIMSEAAMDLYEVRALYPGKGMVLQPLAGGESLNVVEMTASRQLKRSTLLACRLWLLDGVHRFSGSLYDFKSRHRTPLEKVIASLLAHGARHGRHWRERFFLEMFSLWVEKSVRAV